MAEEAPDLGIQRARYKLSHMKHLFSATLLPMIFGSSKTMYPEFLALSVLWPRGFWVFYDYCPLLFLLLILILGYMVE